MTEQMNHLHILSTWTTNLTKLFWMFSTFLLQMCVTQHYMTCASHINELYQKIYQIWSDLIRDSGGYQHWHWYSLQDVYILFFLICHTPGMPLPWVWQGLCKVRPIWWLTFQKEAVQPDAARQTGKPTLIEDAPELWRRRLNPGHKVCKKMF